MSKGSKPRPFFVDMTKFDENWEKIFGPKRTPEEERKDKEREEIILKEMEQEDVDERKTRNNDKH